MESDTPDELTDPKFLAELGEAIGRIEETMPHPDTSKALIDIIISDGEIPKYMESSIVNGFHYMNLRKLSEQKDEEKSLKPEKTRFEQVVLDDAVAMMGYGPEWAAQMDDLFVSLNSSDWRTRNTDFLYPHYKDYLVFLNSMISLRQELKRQGHIDELLPVSDKELMRKIMTFYYIIHSGQKSELALLSKALQKGEKLRAGHEKYQKYLPKSFETDLILMNMLYEINKDGVYDPYEKTIFLSFVHNRVGYTKNDLPFLTDRLMGKLVTQQMLLRDMIDSSDAPIAVTKRTKVGAHTDLTELSEMARRINILERHLDKYVVPHPEEIVLRDYIANYIAGVIVDYDVLVKKHTKPFKVITLCGAMEQNYLNDLTSDRGLNLGDIGLLHVDDRSEFMYRLEANPTAVVLGSSIPSTKMGGSEGTYDGYNLAEYVKKKNPHVKVIVLDKLGMHDPSAHVNLSIPLAMRMGEQGLKMVRDEVYRPTSKE